MPIFEKKYLETGLVLGKSHSFLPFSLVSGPASGPLDKVDH
ncbi:hypothetical protein GCWU000182_01160 [Abiotrophia defectiva ATCC 49176]|uniref:Uncharacterized protein n=1 Tax=Abiotrophia defectiva ATCC 49176 TaxID=592010 RepID=W1Q2Z9_ABIDE|nr:hypothetical protein GCWU000182_01160 [Abiotrophia defectiva ATCC 49176]